MLSINESKHSLLVPLHYRGLLSDDDLCHSQHVFIMRVGNFTRFPTYENLLRIAGFSVMFSFTKKLTGNFKLNFKKKETI